jgi:hypothetical protein
MARKGTTDTDLGLEDIFKEMEKLNSMCVKVGITEDVGAQKVDGGDATLAEYATYNELGVKRKKKDEDEDENAGGIWLIPPRPFVRGWADAKREQIAKTEEMLTKLVADGKLKAETAIRQLGEYGMDGVKSYVKHGSFIPNAKSTKARKRGSSKPLIDTHTMINAVNFQVINKPVAMVSEK